VASAVLFFVSEGLYLQVACKSWHFNLLIKNCVYAGKTRMPELLAVFLET